MHQVKLREREQMARELHDTVAYHVSGIAIQAQAGRTLASSKPKAAVEALTVIEEATSRTLADMRPDGGCPSGGRRTQPRATAPSGRHPALGRGR